MELYVFNVGQKLVDPHNSVTISELISWKKCCCYALYLIHKETTGH